MPGWIQTELQNEKHNCHVPEFKCMLFTKLAKHLMLMLWLVLVFMVPIYSSINLQIDDVSQGSNPLHFAHNFSLVKNVFPLLIHIVVYLHGFC
jgi:hypothetical protein